ncbi:substrate-binding periplasmic protein [Litoribrevibacter albus]|uniref:Solute-binding protein family 3/N-terminal domain-containing protein n=1 Tax=Litoribrevibacter albus TaxID=1473156 RepID=A0AA37W9P0_9GAMM|nr:transporter substrate-binding domain-containing protein [Litoribrevibacter albus]GLQ33584.1 hypothetical protein GCM10007876_40640 [Litoribrevibacter albus]
MKRWALFDMAAGLQGLVLLFWASISGAEENASTTHQLKLAVGEFPPYISESMTGYGLMPKLISKTLNDMGYEVSFQFYPWARVKQMLLEGKVDGSVSWEPSDSLTSNVLFSQHYIVGQNLFYYLKGSDFHWNTFEDLKNYKLGVNIGYEFGPVYDQRKHELNIYDIPEGKSGLGMLLLKRIDAYLNDSLVVQFEAQQFYPNQMASFEQSPTFHAYEYHLLNLSAKRAENKRIMTAFDAAIAKRLASNERLESDSWKFEIKSE